MKLIYNEGPDGKPKADGENGLLVVQILLGVQGLYRKTFRCLPAQIFEPPVLDFALRTRSPVLQIRLVAAHFNFLTNSVALRVAHLPQGLRDFIEDGRIIDGGRHFPRL